MMILIVALKRGDQTLCSDESELIFRGGTGSIHSADSRKSNMSKEVHPHCQQLMPQIPHLGGDLSPMMHQQQYAPIPYEMPIQPYASIHPTEALPTNSGLNCMNGPASYQDNTWAELGNEFDTTNYLSEPLAGPSNDVWATQPQQQQQVQQQHQKPQQSFPDHQLSQLKCLELLQNSDRKIEDLNGQELAMLVSQSEFTVVHNKKRGFCCDCMSECLFYRGCGGPCGECGCFPSAHIDLDRPIDYNRKRLSNGASAQPTKKPRTY
jgi:hypothetical protein